MSISSACKALNDTKEKNVNCLHIMNTVRLLGKEYILIYVKLIIGNRESGTGNWFLVPYLSKRLGYFKILIVNRKSGTSSLFHILVCNTNISKVQIGNKEPFPGSFLTIILFILVYGFVYFISI